MTTIHDKIVLKLQQEKAKNLMPVIVNPDIPRTDANKLTTAYHLPRIRQDIKSWRDAILEAEMPYVPYRVKMQLIFEDTALNGHVKACVQRRKNLTLLKEFAVQDEKDNEDENWTKFFKKKWFSDLINYILDAQFYGFSYINWTGVSNNKLDGVHIIRRQFISPDRNKITSYPYSPTGVDLMDNDIADWTMYVDTPSENGKSPCGYGLYYIVAMYEIILRNLLGQNADFTELFAQPVRWAKSTKREGIEYDMLEQALVNMGSSAYIITDPQDEITLLGGGSIGTGYQSYDNLEARCEKKISKVLLGHADAMDSIPGKLGSGQNKDNPVEMALAEVETTDNQFCENVINDIFIPKLRNLGFNIPANLFFHFSNNKEKDEIVDKEDDRISKAAVFVKTFFDAGMEVDIDWLSERFNIPIKKAEVIANNNQEPNIGNIPPYNRNKKKSNSIIKATHRKDCSCGQHTLGSFKVTNKTGKYIPDDVVDALYNKTGIKYNYQLFKNISDDLLESVRKGFGKHLVRNQVPGVNPKENLYYMMEANTFEFSAAKTAAEIAKGNELLHIDPNQTRQDFQSKLDDMNLLYNEDYLRTEYGTAYATCLNGAQYADRIKDKDLFPYVRWNQIDRPTKREEHEELDGMTFRIDELECIPPVDWNCYDNKTLIYTKRGWIYFCDLSENDFVFTLNPETKQPEWQQPKRFIKKKHNDKMIEIKTTNFSCCVTPEHLMLVRKGWDGKMKNNRLKLIQAKDIADSDCIYKSSEWVGEITGFIQIGKKVIDIETFCKFMGWYLSEGSVTKRGENWYQIYITQYKKDNVKIIENDLINIPFKVNKCEKGFLINDSDLGKYLIQFGHSFEKYVPEIIKNLPKEMIELFLDRFIKGDGWIQPTAKVGKYYSKEIKHIFSSSKKMIDDITELVIKIGKSCNTRIHTKKGKVVKHHNGEFIQNHNVYKLTISESQYFYIQKKKHIKEIDYNDFVYCVEVPNYHTLLVQRDGKIYWSGNCGCSLEYLEDSDVDELEVSDMSDMEEVLKGMDSTNSKYDNYYDQVKDTGFFDNQYKSMQVFDMAAAYNGLPANFNFEDQDLEQIKNMNPNDFDNIEIQDRDSQFIEKVLPNATINDYSNRTLQIPQYELSQSMKNTAEFVSTITKNPDEVFLSKGKLTYVKFYNDKGRVRSMYADAKLSKDGIKVNRWGSLDDADRLRKTLLIHKK